MGNDRTAKDTVTELVTGIGFEAINLGPIRYAHSLEAMLMLCTNARIFSPEQDGLGRQSVSRSSPRTSLPQIFRSPLRTH